MADDIRRWSEELAREPSSMVFLQLSEALRRQGQLDLAFKIAVRGLERHQRNADAHDLVARIAVDRRDFSRAFEEWETVLKFAPDHLGAMKGLGYVCFQQGRFDDAEKFLSRAQAGGAGNAVSNALETVRRSSGSFTADAGHESAPVVAPAVPMAASAIAADPAHLFDDLLLDEGQTALLLDGSGFVMAGSYLDDEGRDVATDVGAQLSGISDEVRRSTRHLDIGDWRSITFETQVAVVAMAPGGGEALVVVAASRATQLGLLRRLLERCAGRAAGWLEAGKARRAP